MRRTTSPTPQITNAITITPKKARAIQVSRKRRKVEIMGRRDPGRTGVPIGAPDGVCQRWGECDTANGKQVGKRRCRS